MHVTSCRVILSTLFLYSSLGDYSFQYRVVNNDDSVQYSHGEDRSEDDTTGHYQVLLPDGRTQVVTYSIPDKDTGYLAHVQYELSNKGTQRKREIIKKVYKKPTTVKQRRNDLKYQSFIRKLYGISSNAHNPTNQTLEYVSEFDKEQNLEVKTYDIIQSKNNDTISDEKAIDNSSDDNTDDSFEHHIDIIMTKVNAQENDLISNKLNKEMDTNFQTFKLNPQLEYSSSDNGEIRHDKTLREDTFSKPVDSLDPHTEQTEDKTENITVEFHTNIPDTFSNTDLDRFKKKPWESTHNYDKQQSYMKNMISNIEYDDSSGTSDLVTIQSVDNEIANNIILHIMDKKDTQNEQSKIMDVIKNKVESDTYLQTIRHPVILAENVPTNGIYDDDIVQEVFEDNFYNKHLEGADHEKDKDEAHIEYQTIKTPLVFPDNFQGKGKNNMQNINKQAFSSPQKHIGNYQVMEGKRFPLKTKHFQEENIVTFRNKRKVSNQAISYFKCIKTFLFNLLPFDL